MKMKMKNKNKTLECLRVLYVFASFFFLLTSSVQALTDAVDSVADSIRIDCGATENYTDPKTNYSYQSDIGRFVDYGEGHNVLSNYTKEQIANQLKTLRSFPKGKRNCYTLPITSSMHYLVRAFFAYGNYDNKSRIPSFDLYIGVEHWATINEADGDVVRFEVIHVSSTDEINVCLVNTGQGTPFISLLEAFPWQNSRYGQTAFLMLMSRSKLGMSKDDATYISYPDDIYRRSWFNRKMENSVRISTSMAIDSTTSENNYKLPKEVLSSAVESVNACSSLVINMDSYSDPSYDYYVYLHFHDFVNKSKNQQREVVITFSDGVNVSFTLENFKPTTLVRNIKKGDLIRNISIRSTSDSQLPAMLNAYEIYRVLPQPVNSTTYEGDVAAIRDIKRVYDIKRISWQGDPCRPTKYTWEGLTCNNNGTPRITSINLRSSNLTGVIAGSFSNFTELMDLDLSNNNLTGEIPESLAVPENLKDINLTGNEFKGPIPQRLLDKKNAGKLNLSMNDNMGKSKGSGMSKASKIGAIVGGTAAGSAAIAGLAYLVYQYTGLEDTLKIKARLRLLFKKKKQEARHEGSLSSEKRKRKKKKEHESKSSGKKKKEEDEDKTNNSTETALSASVKPTTNTNNSTTDEAGSESLFDKVSDAIPEICKCSC